MIIPNRFSNLKFSLLNVTAISIDFLLQENKASMSQILQHLKMFSKDFTRDDVILSVTFLYALGKVEYLEKSDAVKLIHKEELQRLKSA